MTAQQSKAVYKRYTFSLTEEISDSIDLLSTLVPRANRSDILKAALNVFKDLNVEKQKKALSNVVEK